MTITIPDWFPTFILFAWSCFNVWLAIDQRQRADRRLEEMKDRIRKWNAAAKEAGALWEYGAEVEAIKCLEESGCVEVKQRAR